MTDIAIGLNYFNNLKIVFLSTGCPVEDISVPFDSKEFNLTDYLTTARENFIGRQWLYQEIENVFYPTQAVPGVLIIGDPGAGKSALSAQLVCSRTSSRKIHDHVLGYHLCKHSDKNTQIAGKFVRNLAEMIARRLPEYGYIVSNNSHILRSLTTDCVTIQDPVGCFEQAILLPLKSLTNVPKDNWYIVIDALDECLPQSETSHSIVYLLRHKLPRFPTWLKLVSTSRNESNLSFDTNVVKKLIIDPEDPRNLEDIERYLSSRFYRDGPLPHRLKVWFGDDSLENTARLISVLLSKSQGNFLFVKEILRHWETSREDQSDPYRLPRSLGELYHSYFERLYNQKEKFKLVRRTLEVLVSTFEPLTLGEIFHVLRMKEKNLDDDYEFKDRMIDLGHFLRYGKNGTVTLYHQSLSDWLTSENNRGSLFYVSKRKGHEMFCDYYFNLIRNGDNATLLSNILALVQHIAFAGWKEKYVNEFLSFPSQVVNSSDPNSNRTLLHLVATINNSAVMKLVLRHFLRIDSVDNRGITPAFLAAEHGLVDNLALLVGKGAKLNHKTKSLISLYRGESENRSTERPYTRGTMLSVLESKYNFWGSTILHVAALKGHQNVVEFLLNNSCFISTVNEVHLTALHLAAESGHLGVVKALYQAGADADQTALHHAAANNRLEVVKFLLQIGVKDDCMQCDGSFYWLNSRRRFHSRLLPLTEASLQKRFDCPKSEDDCFVFGTVFNMPSKVVVFGELFDDRHLIFCETALHAAASLGHKKIVNELLSKDTRALECHDYTGRTPLHEAVRTNNQEIIEMLLNRPQTKINYPCNFWQNLQADHEKSESRKLGAIEYSMYHTDVCHCGYTPLHLAARSGYTRIGTRLTDNGAQVHAQDCNGATPLHVAACHNHMNFVHFLLSHAGADIYSRTFNGSTPLHSAAACGAIDVIDVLLYHGANLTSTDENGLTALHYTVLNIHLNQLEVISLTNSSDGLREAVKVDFGGCLAKFFHDNNHINNTKYYRWLNSFFHLILRGSDIDAADVRGRTALHIAAENGLADAVNVLLQRNATVNIRNKIGKTPLEIAVESVTSESKHLLTSIILAKSLHDLRHLLTDHELVVYLLLSFGASFKTCQTWPSGNSLLHHALINKQPYIAQLLLLKGASLTCKDSVGRTPLVAYLHNGGKWIDLILKHFNASVAITCGEPFNLSVFHLLCYRSPSQEDLNFFMNTKCDSHKCSSQKGPLTSSIERFLLNENLPVDSCLDAEGFTPLQRAAQGANIVAVRTLIKHGANVSLLSPQGYDALTLAVLHAGSNLWRLPRTNEFLQETMTQASVVATELLRHKLRTSDFHIVCNSSKTELNLYHLAASRGLVKFIEEIFKDKNLHHLDVDCPNKDGITPMYLAKIFSKPEDTYNPWVEVVRFIENQGGQMYYPSRNIEYNIIYNRLYGWIPEGFRLKLRPDVRGFVVGLLSTYGYWQTNSMHCKLNRIDETVMEIGSARGTHVFVMELLQQLKLISRQIFLSNIVASALEDIKMCGKRQKRASSLLSTYVRHERILRPKAHKINERAHKSLYYLMRIWYEDVFKYYACLKTVFNVFGPYFLDERRSKELIKQYEGSTPLWYLDQICFTFEQAFQLHFLHYEQEADHIPFRFLYHEFPSFLRERMGWMAGHLPGYYGSWPLEFLVKFSLGFYRQYDYLKVLNVGFEPKTHISLYSDKMRQVFRRAVEGEKELKRKGRKRTKRNS